MGSLRTMAASQDESPEIPFEQAMERLEAIVEQLEDGELELESALAAFEEGVGLTRRCSELLGAAERRIEILVGEGEKLETRAFADAGDDEEGER